MDARNYTLGWMFDILVVLECPDPFFDSYLRGSEKRGGLYSWRHLRIEDIPQYLDALDAIPGRTATTWTQIQKAIKRLVIRAVDNLVCSLPDGWFIQVNSRGYRFLWSPEWKTSMNKRRGNARKGVVEKRLPPYYGYSPVGLARARLCSSLRESRIPTDDKVRLNKELLSLTPDEVFAKEQEWERIQQAKRALSQCKKLVRAKGKEARAHLNLSVAA